MTRLSAASAVLVALLVIHALDHTLRQQTAVPDALGALGLAGTAAAVAVLVLALMRRPLAGPAAAAVGATTVIGFALAHLVPDWSVALSLPYPDIEADAVSWSSVLVTMAAAVWVAVEGVRVRRGEATFARVRS